MVNTSSQADAATAPAAVGAAAKPARVLLIGGTSEIGQAILAALDLGPDTEVLLAGRDAERMRAAASGLRCRVETISYNALDAGDAAGSACCRVRIRAGGPGDLRGWRANSAGAG